MVELMMLFKVKEEAPQSQFEATSLTKSFAVSSPTNFDCAESHKGADIIAFWRRMFNALLTLRAVSKTMTL